MDEFTQTLHDLPVGSMIIMALLAALGIVLWIQGQKLLRAGFAVLGVVVGGAAGWILGETMNLGLPAWAVAVVGAMALGLIGMMAYRVAVAAVMVIVFAVLAPLCAVAASEWQTHAAQSPPDESEDTKTRTEVTHPATDQMNNWFDAPERKPAIDSAKAATEDAVNGAGKIYDGAIHALENHPELSEQAKEQLLAVKTFAERLAAAIRQRWEQTPEHLRPTLKLSAGIGAVIGLIIGVIVPSFSAAVITSFGGSLLWLAMLQLLLVRIGAPTESFLPQSGFGWLLVWLITAVIGMVIQWTFRKRPADKPET